MNNVLNWLTKPFQKEPKTIDFQKHNETLMEIVCNTFDVGVEDTIQPYNIYVSEKDDMITFGTLSERQYNSMVDETFNAKLRGGYEMFCNKMIYQVLHPLLTKLNQNGFSVEIIDEVSKIDRDHMSNIIKSDKITPTVQLRCVPLSYISVCETLNEESINNIISY